MRSQGRLGPLGLAVGLAVSVGAAPDAAAQAQGVDEADLSVEIIQVTPPFQDDGRLWNVLVRVENDGPDDARDVEVDAGFSRRLDLEDVMCRGVVSDDGTCTLRRLREGRTTIVRFTMRERPDGGGTSVFRVRVDSDTYDPDRSNDRARVVLQSPGPAGVARGARDAEVDPEAALARAEAAEGDRLDAQHAAPPAEE